VMDIRPRRESKFVNHHQHPRADVVELGYKRENANCFVFAVSMGDKPMELLRIHRQPIEMKYTPCD